MAFFGGKTNTNTTGVDATFGGFGTGGALSTGFGGFGMIAPPTATAPQPFGGLGDANTTSAFGSTFNNSAMTTVAPGFGAFGGNTNSMIGQPPPQPVAPQISDDEAFALSLFNVATFGDERDNLIAIWNYVQARWGTGKLFYSQSAAPIDITQENYLCRFKAICYNRRPGKDTKMGLVMLNFSKTLAEVKAHQTLIVQVLHNSIFGNNRNLMVFVEACQELDDKNCQMIIYIEEKSQLIPNKYQRILATDVANYLAQPHLKGQLNHLGITSTFPLVQLDDEQLNEYLRTPPKGIDPRIWQQAVYDNPDPTELIPVPMIGFKDLKRRIEQQNQEAERHVLCLHTIEGDLIELQQRHAATAAKILQYKRNLVLLGQNTLKIIVRQESMRKVGIPLSFEEEMLRTKLESMLTLISMPTQFKSRVSEMLARVRMQRNQFTLNGGTSSKNGFTINKHSQADLLEFLSRQQEGVKVLTDTVTKDLKALDIIIKDLPEVMQRTT